MRIKIRMRLFLYFALSLVSLALLIGLIFNILFSKYNREIHKRELEARADRIAETLSISFTSRHDRMGHGGFGAYLRFLDDIAMTDIWVVDPNLDQIVRGHGHANIAYKDLPENAEGIVMKALAGKKSFSESFSPLLGAPSITVATPILLSDGTVTGVVLLHTRIKEIAEASTAGLWLLAISMLIAILVSFLIAGALSTKFTKPLEKMKAAAQDISSGNFNIKTGISQEDEIGELAGAMDQMAQQLDRASRESDRLEQLRRDFLASVSHELRTPVTVLRGSLEALNDKVISEPETIADYHQQMLAESIHLERLVSDLLDLSKLQNPDFKMEMHPINIKEIVEDAVHSMRRVTLKKNISFALNFHRNSYVFNGDYGRLRQMVMIILSNAIKFSPEGAPIKVELSKKEGRIQLAITDKGRGIHPRDLPHIFDRFYRPYSEKDEGGTGLGLAIAKEIANRHSIELTLVSDLNSGTVVTFLF